jgi:plastocyanin
MTGTWVTSPLNLHFQFAHRFEVAGDEADVTDLFGTARVVNYPTFDVGLGLFPDAMAGVRYSSNSRIARQVNEWQPYVKYAFLRGSGDGEVSLSMTGAWNGATQSVDGELAAQTRFGPVLLLGAVRGFTDAFALPSGADDEALALAGGAGVRLNRYVTLAADVSDIVAGIDVPGDDGASDPHAAWSAGLQIGIPATPHTLSLQATNVYSGTLEGSSTGDPDAIFWGFEFTVPFSGFARWGELFGGDEGRAAPGGGAAEARPAPTGDVVEIEMSDLAFGPGEIEIEPGTTVRWVNRDPVVHNTTSEDDLWDSPLLGPGETWTRTFEETGRYTYTCTPHPFMEGTIIVTQNGR